MEYLLIDENKLKIMLDAEDMRQYALNCEALDGGNSPSRRTFLRILEDIRGKTGFDATGRRVFVQVFPSRDGGCEMFVTKLTVESGKIRRGETPIDGQYCYRFGVLADLLSACARMRFCSGTDGARAYANSTENDFYLVLRADIPNVAEYDGAACTDSEHRYIMEHYRCFAENAVAVLAEFA